MGLWEGGQLLLQVRYPVRHQMQVFQAKPGTFFGSRSQFVQRHTRLSLTHGNFVQRLPAPRGQIPQFFRGIRPRRNNDEHWLLAGRFRVKVFQTENYVVQTITLSLYSHDGSIFCALT